MDSEKMFRFREPEAMEKSKHEVGVHKDIRVWLAAILAIALLYLTAANYPVIW
jgi:hypothetical protein